MQTTINKQRLLTQLFSSHRKGTSSSEVKPRPVLEQFIYGLCREGTTRERADHAFRTLCESFFDWNEVRVSSSKELEESLADLPNPADRAQRLISFLQEVFETTFSFDLEILQKKGFKQAAKQLARFQAADDYVVASVVQQSLGGHAVPLDEPTIRVLRRLGLIDENDGDTEAVHSCLEHLVPKARGLQFSDAVSHVAEEWCWEDEPNCAGCPLAGDCAPGQENGRVDMAAGRSTRPKPR